MSREEMMKAMADFEKNGGQVKRVEEGKRAVDPMIRYCKCGCEGNWTDHTMRLGENGQRASW